MRDELYIQDREITEIGLMVDQAQLEDGKGSDNVNEWDEAWNIYAASKHTFNQGFSNLNACVAL